MISITAVRGTFNDKGVHMLDAVCHMTLLKNTLISGILHAECKKLPYKHNVRMAVIT